MEYLATNTIATLNYLSVEKGVQLSSIDITGISQGGWVTPIVTIESPNLAFVVNLVGIWVPARKQLLYEENRNLRQMGFGRGLRNRQSF